MQEVSHEISSAGGFTASWALEVGHDRQVPPLHPRSVTLIRREIPEVIHDLLYVVGFGNEAATLW
jgi:hypothetical protein